MKDRAIEQMEVRIVELQDIINELSNDNENYKKNIDGTEEQNVIKALKRRMEENTFIIEDTKKDIEATNAAIDILITYFPSAEVNS